MDMTPNKQRLLFLCTGNSCRSQMAEGWARQLLGERYQVYSAGIETHGLNPLAVRAMAEQGVDISSHRSQRLEDLAAESFDLVVTVCDNAQQRCPAFPRSVRVIHHAFDDPPALAAEASSEQEALNPYLRVCGEIRDWVADLPHRVERLDHLE